MQTPVLGSLSRGGGENGILFRSFLGIQCIILLYDTVYFEYQRQKTQGAASELDICVTNLFTYSDPGRGGIANLYALF